MKNTEHLIVKIIASLLFVFFLCSTISAQEPSKKAAENQIEQFLSDEYPDLKAETLPTPETEKATRERRAGNSQNTVTPSEKRTDDYDEMPTVDYFTEAKKFQKELEANAPKQNANAQKAIDEMMKHSQAESERLNEIQNRVIQRQNERFSSRSNQSDESAMDSKEQEKTAKKLAAEQWKWIWLIPLFEILQTIILLLVAFRYKAARKSVIAMTAGLIICLSLIVLVNLQLPILPHPLFGLFGVFIGIISVYAYAIGKLSTYIIISLIPESLSAKLLSVFGIGFSLIAFYILLNSITGYGASGSIFGFGVIFIGGILALFKGVKGSMEDLHGSARFAKRKDFKEFEIPVETGAFILAPEHPEGNHPKLALPRNLSVMHGLIFGGSGTGKTRGYFMANCAEVKNTSLVVTDPKSELWKFTSGYHEKAVRFAPTEPETSQCFNWIPLCTNARMAELCARALMTAGSTHNTDQFWIDAETAFLSAIFAHTAMTDYPTPLTAYRLFTRQKPDELIQLLLNSPSYVAREQAIIFEQTDARIKGAIVPAIAARLQFMRDPSIHLFTSSHFEAPNFGELRKNPMAVYWCLREQDIARLRPLTSLFFTVLLEQIAGEEIPEGETKVPITMMLDEFANIGKIPDFETTISLARGRDVALWLGIQSLSQLNQTYGNHAAQTIMSNCATKIGLHGLDYQTAEYVSKSLGEQTISHASNSFSFGLTGGSFGSHSAKHRRPLLTPDEVMRIGEDEAIARTSNKYPMRLYKGYYNAKPNTFPVTQSLTKIQEEEETEMLAI